MDDRMAVRADRSQIGDRIQAVLVAHFCDRYDVVHLDVSRSRFAVSRLEVEATNDTGPPVVSETLLACPWVPLKCVHENAMSGPLHILDFGRQLFRRKVFRSAAGLLPSRRSESRMRLDDQSRRRRQVLLARNWKDRGKPRRPTGSRRGWLEMRLITWIEREKQADSALRRIKIGDDPARRFTSEGGPVLGFAVFELRETITESVQP